MPWKSTRTCLASSIKSKHQQSHLLGSEDLVHYLGYRSTHCAEYGSRILLPVRYEALRSDLYM